MYLVSVLNKKASVQHPITLSQELELSWIDWQIWAIPVFKYKKDALKYAWWRKELITEIWFLDINK